MTDFLVRRIARQPRGAMARIALGLALAAVALGIRLALAPLIGMGAPFGAFILAVLVATVFGGVIAGVTSVVLLAGGGVLMLAPAAPAVAVRRAVFAVTFFLASSGFVIWIITLLRAALLREVAAREGERLLKLELHHRVKNTLAVVQSLAEQTFRDAADAHAARRQFTDRLVALAGAHDLLVDAGWRAVTLDTLAAQAMAPFRPVDGRLVVDGGPVEISPEVAVALALCLHELATNASKYGALADGGRVRLAWAVDEAGGRRRLELEWRETGGPKPAPVGRQGFGTRLLTRALAAQSGAATELSFPAEGALWRAGFDL
ncbi:sensor histidine kinase [Phenylobacterium sp.]|uniref:sensor histidine kinase n=1 Tax=Phenylobacterium sp. TaxID=1871053 RepID=UPI002EDA311C